MLIGRVRSAEHDDLNGSSSAQESSISRTDVNYFASLMDPSALASTTPSYTTPQSMLSDASGKLASVTQRMTNSLRALSGDNKFDEATPFPGVAALAPVAGAVFIILAGVSDGSFVSRALAWRPMVWTPPPGSGPTAAPLHQ